MANVEIVFQARPYQRALVEYFRGGGKRAFEVWHRKAGKDRAATFLESELALQRIGLYWHALPRYEDARKVIWDAIMPDGQRLIDWAFPKAICRKRLDHEMKIELVNGSIWQPIGADNFDALVGASPVHVTYSEFALMHPNARTYIRPAIVQNKGSELIITTPRGYNHAHELWEYARTADDWHTSLMTVNDTGVLTEEDLREERATMPDELFRQEYFCDWSAANVGSILGRYLEAAEREGRINDEVAAEAAPRIEISSDIGFRDTSAWWFWQARPDGFALVDYDEGTGMDAENWAERLKQKPYDIGHIWLPHDARARTFAAKRSAVETFLTHFGEDHVRVVPALKSQDKINAARLVMRTCRFNKSRCADGLKALREWCFDYNEETRAYSREPRHDWASHAGDGFAYGATVMQSYIKPAPPPERGRILAVGEVDAPRMTLEDLWTARDRQQGDGRRI